MLGKVRHFVDKPTLVSIYYAIFHSLLSYGSLGLGQNTKNLRRLSKLQKKAIRLITFSKYNAHTNPLFNDMKILKLNDLIAVENCLFLSKCLNKTLPDIFDNFFTLSTETHSYNT